MTTGACCAWGAADAGGAIRLNMKAMIVTIMATLATVVPATHLMISAFASDTSPFVASNGSKVSSFVSSFVRRLSISSPPPLGPEGLVFRGVGTERSCAGPVGIDAMPPSRQNHAAPYRIAEFVMQLTQPQ